MKQVTLKRLRHQIDTRCLYLFRATYYILHFIHGVQTLPALPSSVSIFFSDAIAWQNAAYPGVPGRIPAESALV